MFQVIASIFFTAVEIIALIVIKFVYWAIQFISSGVMGIYLLLQVLAKLLDDIWIDLGGDEEEEENEDE